MGKRETSRMPSQRQLRVGEQIRHVLADIFMRGELYIEGLRETSITVSLVKVGPDLRNATAYVTPLAGVNAEETVRALNTGAPLIRKMMNKEITIKFSPKLYFKLDKSFEHAAHINALLKDENIVCDLTADTLDS